jgi:hypothetical protein
VDSLFALLLKFPVYSSGATATASDTANSNDLDRATRLLTVEEMQQVATSAVPMMLAALERGEYSTVRQVFLPFLRQCSDPVMLLLHCIKQLQEVRLSRPSGPQTANDTNSSPTTSNTLPFGSISEASSPSTDISKPVKDDPSEAKRPRISKKLSNSGTSKDMIPTLMVRQYYHA